MSLINLRQLPKHSFISLIIPHIQTFHNEFGLYDNNITLKNNKFTLNSRSSYNYTISELNKTTFFYTHITSLINKHQYDIHERITIKNNTNQFTKDNYINYSINIVDKNKPLIYSIKCIEQPMSVDLMKHYTDEIKQIYKTFV
jgi:CYTH domain-containing protein